MWGARLFAKQDLACVGVLFGVAVLLRLAYLQQPQTPLFSFLDAASYVYTAQGLAEGETIRSQRNFMASRGPVYPLFLAGIRRAVGDDLATVRLAHALLGAATCVAVFVAGSQAAGRGTGFCAGLLTATAPGLILETGQIHTETLAMLLLWIGMALLTRGLCSGSERWSILGGLAIALACLTRTTLVPTLPFLLTAALLGGEPLSWKARLRRACLVSAAILLPLAAWHAAVQAMSLRPVVGVAGVRMLGNAIVEATDPLRQGWILDSGLGVDPAWWRNRLPHPLYPLAALLNLEFIQLWFVDNMWRQSLFGLAPHTLDAFQRLSVVLGLAGLGLAALRWRELAPTLALVLSASLVASNYIEPRHLLPMLPAFFICAGLAIEAASRWRLASTRLAWVSLGLIGAALVLATAPIASGGWFGRGDPSLLGSSGDTLAVIAALCMGVAIQRAARAELPPRARIVAGLLPALVFAAGFVSYTYLGSDPRWRSWRWPLSSGSGAIEHQVALPSDLDLAGTQRAAWLVDLEASGDPATLQVSLNGRVLERGQYRWHPLVCSEPHPRGFPMIYAALGGDPSRRHGGCIVYEPFARFKDRSASSYPQWWVLDFKPELLFGSSVAAVGLTPTAATGEPLWLGGSVGAGDGSRVYGPSPRVGSGMSMLRWEVLEDWRLWLPTLVQGERANRLRVAAAGNRRDRYVADQLARKRLGFNILLLLVRDGRAQLY